MATLELQIDKMHCGACVRRVTQALNGLPDTHANSVAVGTASVTTAADPGQILETLSSAGFPAQITSQRS